MGKIAIHGISVGKENEPLIEPMISLLQENQREIFITEKLSSCHLDVLANFPRITKSSDMSDFEAILSLGGDGTLLDTLTYVGSSEVPIMGINLGRLGFLATISKDDIITAINSYLEGHFEYDNRTLISLVSEIKGFEDNNYALNEFAILRKDTSSMIVVKCYLNGEFLNTYWADGLMVATPTGSTGYSLSCGGPVIMPQTKNFIITPVSPHNLNVRALIVSDDSELTFKVETRNQSYLVTLDSRSFAIDSETELTIKKAKFQAKLIKVKGSSFVETLKNKLTWGLDRRN